MTTIIAAQYSTSLFSHMAEFDDTTEMEFRGLPVFLSTSAVGECLRWRMSIHDIVAILDEGVDCSECQRRSDVIERCSTFRHQWMKVVAVANYHYTTKEECWLVTHVGEAKRP